MTQLKTPTKDITKTIIDPVCGMNVPFGKIDLVVKYQGCSYYFCAEACRKAFEENPRKYLETKVSKKKAGGDAIWNG